MKSLLSIIFIFIINTAARAQQTVTRTNYIANSITERFSVLKSNKKLRQGDFTATFTIAAKNITVAKGGYQNGSRTGSWSFFNSKGKLIQTYNYDEHRFTLLDTPDTAGPKYYMENVKPADTVIAPVKIGGSCYGWLPLLYRDELSQQVRQDNPGIQKAEYTHVIIINEQGNIISHIVTVNVNGNIKKYPLDDSLLSADITHFTPATLNHKPVPCQITNVTYGSFYGAVTKTF